MSDVRRLSAGQRNIAGVGRFSVHSGLVVEVAEDSLDRVTKLLAGVNNGVRKAVGSALTRAAATGKTTVKKAIAKEYTISESEFLRRTRNINHFVKGGQGGIAGIVFGFAGNVIPLITFNTRINGEGRVVTNVKRSGAAEVLESAFSAHMGAHHGIYERVGTKRYPVEEFFGPATPQMMYSNENVLDEMEEKMAETYMKRLDHEILRILNGWGG